MQKCEIRNNPGMSSYFGGGYRGYGHYQWNIKYYGWQNEYEIESAVRWAFGEYLYSKRTFDQIVDIFGRPVKCHTDGRSGGWFVIDEPLSKSELRKMDRHINHVMKNLPEFLKEERKLHSEVA